jgi:anti-sigma factor RsiW
VAGLLLWSAGSRVNLARQPTLSEFASLGVDTHLQQVRGQLPLEVRSTCPRDVAGWFAGRVPFQLELADTPAGPGEQSAYSLVGGRLVPFHGEHAAYVLYSVDERPVSLLVTSAAAFQPGSGSKVKSGPLTFHVESVGGLRVITWSDRGLTYALMSDVQTDGARSCLVCHGSQHPAMGAPFAARGGKAPRPGRIEVPRGCQAS